MVVVIVMFIVNDKLMPNRGYYNQFKSVKHFMTYRQET